MDIVANYATRVIVMNSGQIVADGSPEAVFYDQYEALEKLRLKPPTVVEFCRRLQSKGMPRFLTLDELLAHIKYLGGNERDIKHKSEPVPVDITETD
jgi:energy-coupling factor transport system ATP-binding protein